MRAGEILYRPPRGLVLPQYYEKWGRPGYCSRLLLGVLARNRVDDLKRRQQPHQVPFSENAAEFGTDGSGTV